jgi:hypothetical protein
MKTYQARVARTMIRGRLAYRDGYDHAVMVSP